MKKYIISVACILAALVSCQKNDAPVQTPQENQPIKVTLTATIGSDDTKVSFVDENNVLKTAWEVGDKVSVLALDNSKRLISNTILTATTAGKSAEFDGVFVDDPSIKSLYVYYPALTEGDGEAEATAWHSSLSYNSGKGGALYGAWKGETYISYGSTLLQKENASPEHLSDYIVLHGVADKEELLSGSLSTTLYHRSYILKVSLTLPEENLDVSYLNMSCKSEDGISDVTVTGSGWTDIKNPTSYFPGGSSSYYIICFGDDIDGGSGTGFTLDGNTLTAYIVAYAGQRWNSSELKDQWFHLSAGDYLDISLSAGKGVEWYEYVAKYTFKKNTTLENGKMYRMSATLEKQD